MSHPKWELIKKWNKNHFTLRLYYLDGVKLYYVFKDGHKIIFEGKDFRPSPMHSHDSLDTVYALLGFLAMQEGDTDKEYFEKYTPEQLAWTHTQRCEELNMLVYDWEIKREEQMTHERRNERRNNDR